jgi:hypothetical protein
MANPTNRGTNPGGQASASTAASASLSDRTAIYRDEIEKIVAQVGEHPLFEMKHSCTFQNLAEKIEFVRDIQSIATSRIESEKYLIIGADESLKTFHAVQNLADFDEATIRQVLDKYLSPIPDFEVFKLKSSSGMPYILFVIPKQKTRRILAKVTVEDSSLPSKPKLLLREGDLWTKGTNTGKRLAKPEDWDEIYEEIFEARIEHQTRQRTAHMLETAIAREKIQTNSRAGLPIVFNDIEFKALMEDICAAQDVPRFKLLLERLRDDLVEGWHQIGAYEQSQASYQAIHAFKHRVSEHAGNVIRPAMHWLTLAGIYVVKNSGPKEFLDSVVDLLGEVFETSHKLTALNLVMPLGGTSKDTDEHLSRTVPALESLISLYIIGAYIMKRGRLEFFRSLFRPDVVGVGPYVTDEQVRAPMVFWPFGRGSGEPEELSKWGGRIAYCASRIQKDTSYLAIFGSQKAAIESLCQLEFCLELNSYSACSNDDAKRSAGYVTKMFPNVNFGFNPFFAAYSLENIQSLALTLFGEIKRGKAETLKLIFLDPALASFWVQPGSEMAFTRFVGHLAANQSIMFLQNSRLPPIMYWPKDFAEAMKAARNK